MDYKIIKDKRLVYKVKQMIKHYKMMTKFYSDNIIPSSGETD